MNLEDNGKVAVEDVRRKKGNKKSKTKRNVTCIPQMAPLKLALLLIIIDVPWVAHAAKGTRAFITNVFLLMQAFKMIRQEKLSHACELVNAICPPTLSCTSQVRRPVQIIAVFTR